MSIPMVRQAMSLDLPKTSKLVFIALCESANADGECFLLMKTLQVKCGLKERALQNHIAFLIKNGFVDRQIRPGRCSFFSIKMPEKCTPASTCTPHPDAPTPASACTHPRTYVHPPPHPLAPITVLEPLLEPLLNLKDKHQDKPVAYSPISDLKERGVDEQTANDFLQHRKKIRAEVSRTVVARIAVEAEKAGISLQEALQICCMRGWRGFNADWVAPRPAGFRGAGGGYESAKDRSRRQFIEQLQGNRRRGGKDVIDV